MCCAPLHQQRSQTRFEGFSAIAQLEASVRVPSIDFTFKTDPLEQSSSDFAAMRTEVSGKVEVTHLYDTLGMMQQLGAVPAPVAKAA